MNRPTPPPLLCVRGLWKKENPLGVVSAKSAEVSPEVSQVLVMPIMLIFLLVMRSDSTGALSCMERALTVPKRRLRTPGPRFRLTSPAGIRRGDMNSHT